MLPGHKVGSCFGGKECFPYFKTKTEHHFFHGSNCLHQTQLSHFFFTEVWSSSVVHTCDISTFLLRSVNKVWFCKIQNLCMSPLSLKMGSISWSVCNLMCFLFSCHDNASPEFLILAWALPCTVFGDNGVLWLWCLQMKCLHSKISLLMHHCLTGS